MKKVLILLVLIALFSSCAKSTYLPYATTNRQGELSVKRNKVINNDTWIHRNYRHEGR
jgi:hypothetical protein